VTPTLHRWGSVSAIAFAALVVAWFALAAVPVVMDAPERILDVYADDGVRARVFAGTVGLAFAGAFLLAFLADVCALLRAAERGPLADSHCSAARSSPRCWRSRARCWPCYRRRRAGGAQV